MDQAKQAAALGFLRGGFAVAILATTIQHLDSSLAIASPVCLPQINHCRSSLLSSDDDDTMLAVKQLTPRISSCVVVLCTSKIRVSSVVACFCYTVMYIIQSLFFILQNVYMHCIKILHFCM